MVKCTACGTALDLTADRCPACGAEVELGRLTGILGLVCRACDAYNDPGARTCAACGKPLGTAPDVAAPPARIAPRVRTFDGARAAPGPATPAAPAAALVLEQGAATPGTTYRVEGEARAGRAPGGLSFPADAALAPHHATFLWHDGRLRLRDEGAPAGTFLRVRVEDAPSLRPGDVFALGLRPLRYAGPLPPPAQGHRDGTRRLGSPRPDGPAAVVEELLEDGSPGRVHVCPGASVVMGRAGAALDLGDDPFLSPAHAELRIEPDGSARLRDLGSAAGTFLRLPPGEERPLQDGDLVRLGAEVLRVSLPGT